MRWWTISTLTSFSLAFLFSKSQNRLYCIHFMKTQLGLKISKCTRTTEKNFFSRGQILIFQLFNVSDNEITSRHSMKVLTLIATRNRIHYTSINTVAPRCSGQSVSGSKGLGFETCLCHLVFPLGEEINRWARWPSSLGMLIGPSPVSGDERPRLRAS